MAAQADLSKYLDKEYEDLTLAEILAAPPSALAGLTERHEEALKVLGIKTVGDLGKYKHFVRAQAMLTLTK